MVAKASAHLLHRSPPDETLRLLHLPAITLDRLGG